jgi:hypothetical protein
MHHVPDPQQLRSWLSSPLAAFLGLLGSVITLGQFTVAAYRWISDRMQGEGSAKRVYAAVLILGFTALAVVAPLSWSVVLTVAHKAGNEGLVGALYPFMINGCTLGGLLTLYYTRAERLPGWPWRPAVLLLLGFGGTALCETFSGAPTWEIGVVDSLPAVVWLTLAYTGLSFIVKRAKLQASA